jgi:Glycoside hydrolase family 44
MNQTPKFALFFLVAAILCVPAFGTVATPTVKVTPASSSVTTAQSLKVTIAVSGAKGTPAGSVVLSSGAYSSAATTLSAGSASITIPAGSLAAGSDTLTGKYTPGSASSSTYGSASGTAAVTVTVAITSVAVTVDVLANRHGVSPFIYGGAFPNTTADVSDSGISLVRWGGNATSNYNWQLKTYNAGNDWYFEDFTMGGTDPDSVKFITDMHTAGSHALMTMPMMGWVAKSAENGTNGHWSYSVAKYGTQCSADQWNSDAGDGLESDCNTPVTASAVTGAYYPLLDTTGQSCPSGSCVYRDAWAKALATAFGTGTCAIPETSITSCHFYDMDNEMDIWGGTHRDVHPKPSGYDELANIYEKEAKNLTVWDPAAVRFGPVSCCWWFYWNGANSNDKAAHGGVDFLPWWLNQINWLDKIHGARTLDVFDIHAYPDADTGSLTTAQLQALSASIYRDYWDPTYTSPAGVITQPWSTSMQPKYSIPFRIPRMKAMVNAIYPGTPLSFTEWSAAFYKESDFSTALGDADAYGIFGRENIAVATRWVAPVSGNPNYLALKLYANYDSAHHGFGTVSIADKNNGKPSLFSSYAALNAAGTGMTIMVLNKDPRTAAKVTFTLTGFTPSTYKAYTLASTASGKITASTSAAWNATQTFAPYTATLLVITGSEIAKPVSEWYVNPDDLMIPASGTAALHPTIRSGSATVTVHSAAFDAYEGAAACSGSLVLTNSTVTAAKPGTITVDAGSTPGFCHYTVTGGDGTATQTQGGWIVVGNPAATLTASSGNNQSGAAGTVLPKALTVTLSPGQSGGSAQGAGILFTTSAGTLTFGTTSGTSVIATTNSSGVASVTLKLPSTKGTVTVTAQDQFALGGASVKFTETAQ